MSNSITHGVHHVGLAVSDLDASSQFFTDLLGWEKIGDSPEYPAIFVSDGVVMVTLWQTKSEAFVPFNKDINVGLHHLAFQIASLEMLKELHKKMVETGIQIEFSPEPLRGGPTQHMICYEPSGNRIEFIVVL